MENKTCKQCGADFEVSDFEKTFIDKISPVFNGNKHSIPLPDICPNCRLIKRTAHRNEQYMYNSKFETGEPAISLYAPNVPWSGKYRIWPHEKWWSDSWNPMDSGFDFDFNRTFFEQFSELDKKIPRINLVTGGGNENSDFTTGTGRCKNCYLINCSEFDEDCYYGKLIQSSKDVMDSCYVYDSELLYECFNDTKCYGSVHLYYSQNSTNCYFSENLSGCSNCLLCTNLSNKNYHYLNKPISKEEFIVRLKDCTSSDENVKKALDQLMSLRAKRIHKFANIVNGEKSTGDFITNCKDCVDCYYVNDSENSRYVVVGVEVKDNLDCSNMYVKPELCYEVLGTIEDYNILFSIYVFYCRNILYSQFCYNSKDLFGCVGLRNKQYCIFNKQYTKEEYEKLVPKIIDHMKKTGEWGKFFPISMSPFAYNETVAHEYFPLTKQQAEAKGYNWKEKDTKEYQPQSFKVPENISDLNESVLKEVLACEKCGKNYKIIPHELLRLKHFNMPAPKLCFDCRQARRMSLRNNLELYHRSCMCAGECKSHDGQCKNGFETTYAPDRPEKVYCESCYQKSVL